MWTADSDQLHVSDFHTYWGLYLGEEWLWIRSTAKEYKQSKSIQVHRNGRRVTLYKKHRPRWEAKSVWWRKKTWRLTNKQIIKITILSFDSLPTLFNLCAVLKWWSCEPNQTKTFTYIHCWGQTQQSLSKDMKKLESYSSLDKYPPSGLARPHPLVPKTDLNSSQHFLGSCGTSQQGNP